ncbi:dol-P-Man:Man(7)GlcNAc(2)-PP-Dol alpha-1,6-mannosyltransferase isoform X4 [Phalaenopsis equestris]|uniref:dol-P-Man:Man(7)GlcNAc(2)-PP-Dol alpha-1,6-mannosyltransferase isoform X4 n=1 Tax=Phalaenopsis equestris TaxID=78828 RepID=UPI0009E32112|nr:dol-P-Man:Man(7)GlcNAc(2)-PP-Dol alpha-1,6-mannosyltransferase isoform X4 [Phalaenopsis equestris]
MLRVAFLSFLSTLGGILFWDRLLPSTQSWFPIEESFNVQAMHDILYHRQHIDRYDHCEFPGVVPRTFVGAIILSILASPVVAAMQLFDAAKICSLLIVRLVLGCLVLSALRFFRIKVRRKFGFHVEAFFAMLTALQFHLLFYSTRPLPNILAFILVNLAYGFWFEDNATSTLKCLTVATVIFRCDTVLLFVPIAVELLLSKSISLLQAIKCCLSTAVLCIGFTLLVDSIFWQRILWPELEVFWFNSILNRSSEWGTHAFYWYFTSALPRSLLVAYPLSLLGVLLDRRMVRYFAPVFSFVLLYSKLPHKELRFIICSVPIFNVSAAVASNRVYNNRRKNVWRLLFLMLLGSLLVSLGCSAIMFLASYDNYPGGHAMKALHQMGYSRHLPSKTVHIDSFTAMNGVSRFSEEYSWRYSKEEGIALEEYRDKNFTFLLNSELPFVDGYKCLFAVNGFSRAHLQKGFPPFSLVSYYFIFGGFAYLTSESSYLL